jgi:hypothetical protein
MFRKKSIGKKRFAIAMMLGLFAIGLGDQAEGYVKDTNGVLRCVDKEKNDAVLSAYKKHVEAGTRKGGELNLSDPNKVRTFLMSLAGKAAYISGKYGQAADIEALQLLEYIFMDGAGFGIKIVEAWDADWAEAMFGVIAGFGERMVREGPSKLVGYFLNPPKDTEGKKVWECMTNTMARHGGMNGVGKCDVDKVYGRLIEDKEYGDSKAETKGKFEKAMKGQFGLTSPEDDLKLIKSPMMYILSGAWSVGEYYRGGNIADVENEYREELKMTEPLWLCGAESKENAHRYVQLKFATDQKSKYNSGAPVLDKGYQSLLRMMKWARNVREEKVPFEGAALATISCSALGSLDWLENAIELEAIINYAAMLRFWGIGFNVTTNKYYVADQKVFLKSVTGHNKLRMSRMMQFLNIMGFSSLSKGLLTLLKAEGQNGNSEYAASLPYWEKSGDYRPRIF